MAKDERRTILVTGSTGTVGSEVVKQLTSRSLGYGIIRAGVHSTDKTDKLKGYDSVEIVNLDYKRQETITRALKNVDKIFLLNLPSLDMIDICSNLIKDAKKNDVKYIVKLSVMGADAEPENAVVRLHRQEERIIEESGIPFSFLRPNAFMQNFVNYYGRTIKNENAFYLPAGDGKISFVDARDIAAVAARVITENGSQHENKVYEITGQEALSFGQAAEILSKEIGRTISYVNIPKEDARKGMKTAGMEDWLIGAIMEAYGGWRAGHASKMTDVVKQITGRMPILFAQFAKDYAEVLR